MQSEKYQNEPKFDILGPKWYLNYIYVIFFLKKKISFPSTTLYYLGTFFLGRLLVDLLLMVNEATKDYSTCKAKGIFLKLILNNL